MPERQPTSPDPERITLRDVLGNGGAELIEESIGRAEGCTSGELVVRVVQALPAGAPNARTAALHEFDRLALSRTKLRNGILLYIALNEHAIELVADEGISALVPQSTWESAVEIISLGFRVGEPAAAIAMAVIKVGDLLSDNFPCEIRDVNELPNSIGWVG